MNESSKQRSLTCHYRSSSGWHPHAWLLQTRADHTCLHGQLGAQLTGYASCWDYFADGHSSNLCGTGTSAHQHPRGWRRLRTNLPQIIPHVLVLHHRLLHGPEQSAFAAMPGNLLLMAQEVTLRIHGCPRASSSCRTKSWALLNSLSET